MTRIPVFILVLTLVGLCSCIERYYPEEEGLRTGSLVVTAHLTNIPGIQSVNLSRSVSIEKTSTDPMSSCYVELARADGELRIFEESEPGAYQGDLDGSFLQTGNEYRLNILTAEGKRYESEYEMIHPAPEIED